MTKPTVQTAAGDEFALTFIPGMPPTLSAPNLYLLDDGSIVTGVLVMLDRKLWLRSFNLAGMKLEEISVSKIKGWASVAPRSGLFD